MASLPLCGDVETKAPVGEFKCGVYCAIWGGVFGYRVHWRAEIVDSCSNRSVRRYFYMEVGTIILVEVFHQAKLVMKSALSVKISSHFFNVC